MIIYMSYWTSARAIIFPPHIESYVHSEYGPTIHNAGCNPCHWEQPEALLQPCGQSVQHPSGSHWRCKWPWRPAHTCIPWMLLQAAGKSWLLAMQPVSHTWTRDHTQQTQRSDRSEDGVRVHSRQSHVLGLFNGRSDKPPGEALETSQGTLLGPILPQMPSEHVSSSWPKAHVCHRQIPICCTILECNMHTHAPCIYIRIYAYMYTFIYVYVCAYVYM